MNPAEALRLSRAVALAKKHGADMDTIPQAIVITEHELAAVIDEVTAAKDATITALRKELNDAMREGEREARDAYSQGKSDSDEEKNYRDYF